MSRFYDAMRRAFEEETDKTSSQPETKETKKPQEPRTAEPDVARFDAELKREPVRRYSDATQRVVEESETYLEAEVFEGGPAEAETTPDDLPVRLPKLVATREEGDVEQIALQRNEQQGPETNHRTISAPYERIIQRLISFRGGRRHCVVMVAGAVPGEGASTVARSLAEALAQSHDDRVVLVDANLRDPVQANAYGIQATAGLTDVLARDAKPRSVVRAIPNTGLSVVTAGSRKKGSPQLLTVPALQSTMTSLYSDFDWIILDGPPITTYPDASSLASVADGAILVVRAEQTRWEVAEEAKKILNQSGVAILGGVLNRRRYHIPDFIYRRL